MNSHELLIQSIGVVALLLGILSFQFNKRLTILHYSLVSGLLWTVHYALLGAYTGSAMNFLTAGRSYAYYKAGKNRNVLIPLVISLAFSVAAVLTWKNNYSALPLAGSLIGTVALWQTNPAHIRWIILFGPICWNVYNLKVSHSIPAICSDYFILGSLLLAIYRFDLAPRLKRGTHKRRKSAPRKLVQAAAGARR